VNDLDELKTLLFGAEKEVLDSIQQRVQTPEARAADIAAVLPEAIRLRHREDDELVESLKDPFGRILRQSLRETPEEFSDALYPVMGPAIRKSIAHALKAFAERINQTLEYSLSVKGLKWRMEAARAGIPFPSYVIQQSLLYRVEQAYLISRENGLLVGHVHHDASRIKDSDAVSAMFTAIQDFVKESFSPDRSGRLETADMGEFTLWAMHGPHALLVCVIRGTPPRELRTELIRVLERLHFRYGEALREYSGDTTSVAGIEDELNVCLELEASRQPESSEKGPPWKLIIIGLLLLAAAGYAAWTAWQEAERYSRLENVLADTPGIYVGNIDQTNAGYELEGMRDPLAADLATIAARAGLEPEKLSGDLRRYRSLDPDILFKRAQQQLDPEPGTAIALLDGTLVVSGTATAAWIATAKQKALAADLGWPVDFTDLQIAGWPELRSTATGLDGENFYFTSGADMNVESAERLGAYASSLVELADAARNMQAAMRITISGYTDSTGNPAVNERLAMQRASTVAAFLQRAGVPPVQMKAQSGGQLLSDGPDSVQQRRATIEIELSPPGE